MALQWGNNLTRAAQDPRHLLTQKLLFQKCLLVQFRQSDQRGNGCSPQLKDWTRARIQQEIDILDVRSQRDDQFLTQVCIDLFV